MYQLGKRIRHHRKLRNTVLIVGVLVLAGFGIHKLFHTTVKPVSVIHNAPPRTTNYTGSTAATVHVDEPLFGVDLPQGWKKVASNADVNVPTVTFRSPSSAGQQLEVFIDTVPATEAVNRVVAVTAQGSGLDHGDVSDNCTTFTPSNPATAASGVTNGIWQGDNFLCDSGNYERDVVGIASPDGINTVKLTGPTTGTHKVFLAYTDNNVNPDFSTLYNILESFKLK